MEFIRDMSSLGWNILFPLLLVARLRRGVLGRSQAPVQGRRAGRPGCACSMPTPTFFQTKYVQFIPIDDLAGRHRQGRAFSARHADRPSRRQALLGQRELAERLYPRALAADRRQADNLPQGHGHGQADPLRGLGRAGHPCHEHDVQLPLRRGVRDRALPQERVPEAAQGHAASGRSSSCSRR